MLATITTGGAVTALWLWLKEHREPAPIDLPWGVALVILTFAVVGVLMMIYLLSEKSE